MPSEKKPRKLRAPKDPSLRHKMYVYRLYPTCKQIGTLEWVLRRWKELYNASLQERSEAYRMCGVSVNYQMQSEQLPAIKEERAEYQEIYSQVLQEVLQRMKKAMDTFFRRVKDGEKVG